MCAGDHLSVLFWCVASGVCPQAVAVLGLVHCWHFLAQSGNADSAPLTLCAWRKENTAVQIHVSGHTCVGTLVLTGGIQHSSTSICCPASNGRDNSMCQRRGGGDRPRRWLGRFAGTGLFLLTDVRQTHMRQLTAPDYGTRLARSLVV